MCMPQEQTDLQIEILRLLDEQQTIKIHDLADAIDESAVSIDIECYNLCEKDLIQHLGKGRYRLTDQGNDNSVVANPRGSADDCDKEY